MRFWIVTCAVLTSAAAAILVAYVIPSQSVEGATGELPPIFTVGNVIATGQSQSSKWEVVEVVETHGEWVKVSRNGTRNGTNTAWFYAPASEVWWEVEE